MGAAVLVAAAYAPITAQPPARPARPPAQQPVAEPHAAHGTPEGWKFTLPKGDPVKGREVFAKLECYACHEVQGETFPAPTERAKVGPELSQMAPLHAAEFFAEGVINPAAAIEKGKGYEAADGSSKMPEFNDVMAVKELIDLVAYLRSLKPGAGAGGGHRGH
ncbi:MAG: c-type cytochrome [Candidatus Rokuibacteriota bacterium]